MYLIDSSSPLVPGERPSNSSDASVLICASKASGVMTSSAGFSFSAGLSAAESDNVAARTSQTTDRDVFISLLWRRSVGVAKLSAFLGRPGGRFLFVLRLDADLFQERFARLFAAEKFFDRHRHIA